MLSVIQTLETQHRALERLVTEANVGLATRDLSLVTDRVGRVGSLLQAHFALEQGQFYPRLEELTRRDQGLERVATAFSQNMGVIADGVLRFFIRHGMAPLDLERFLPDWKQILSVLNQRMVAEEQTLHPLLRRLLLPQGSRQ